ncbi:MAG: ferrochelatase [Cytophagales bacterium]|nr:ferrochelatase [Cytophagales bacterium]
MGKNKGILLLNLGTPKSPKLKDVYHYLREFLSDPYVIDKNWLIRTLLVYGIIVPFRIFRVQREYQKIFDEKKGMPLNYYTESTSQKLQELLPSYEVRWAMRYPYSSLKATLLDFKQMQVKELIILSLFPQYATSTTGSLIQVILGELKKWSVVPPFRFLHSFWDNPDVIQAFSEQARPYLEKEDYDKYVFSYHGLPERHLKKAHTELCQMGECCLSAEADPYCYRANCFGTTEKIRNHLSLAKDKCITTFQSRLGRSPWIKPYTDEVIVNLPKSGVKRVLLFTPSFVSDCLETIIEVRETYAKAFQTAGGEYLKQVPCPNDSPDWINTLKKMVENS